ncbi:unnamed protein product, partial [Brassica oleracea]
SRFPLILPYKSLFLHFFCKIKSLTFLTNHKPIISLLSSLVYRSLIDMADVMRPEKLDMSNDTSSLGSPELLHVLAVDDSIVDRKFIERLLRVSSCKVTVVDSTTRALQYLGLDGNHSSVGFEDLKINLIMTDYSMPGMTGYELMKKIKESSAFREIPVVIMSSENILPRIDRCLEEGAEDFLLKPVKLADVKRLRDSLLKADEMAFKNIMHKRELQANDIYSQLKRAKI